MRKLPIILITGIAVYAAIGLLMPEISSLINERELGTSRQFQGDEEQSTNVEDASASETAKGSTVEENKVLVAEDSPIHETTESIRQRELVDYSENWCHYGQLSERDQEYAKAELKDWEASTGRFTFSSPTEFGYQGYGNSYVVEPYLEIAKSDLIAFIREQEPMAMFAAIDRDDFELMDKSNVAERLLVLGYTGKAIQHLVIHEMLLANIDYSTQSKAITGKVKQHLAKAISYAAYGLQNHDAIGFVQLINMFDVIPEFKDDLNPALALSKSDLGQAVDYAEQLSDWVNSERDDSGLPALDRELNKIAKHELDRDLGRLFGKEPVTMQILSENFGSQLPQLATSECRAKHSQLFAKRD